MSALESITVPVETAAPNTLHMRTVIATAKMPDGREAELAMSVVGTLVLTVGPFDGNDGSGRLVQAIRLAALGGTWMRAIVEAGL